MIKRLVIVVGIFLPLGCFSQTMDYSTPERLGSSVNSDAEESLPLLSSDANTLFICRSFYVGNVGGKYAGSDVWVSVRSGREWLKADNEMFNFNSKHNTAIIGMNTSGDILYLAEASGFKKVNGIYFTKRVGKEWSKPELIPISGIESNGFLNFHMSATFDVLFISMERSDSKGKEDLYVSVKEPSGQWTKPKNLGPTINTSGFEISPFLSSDKKRLYFASNGHPGMGDADIFVSERLYGSWEAWSVPQNLGKEINSPKFDAYFSTYGDSICFFSSNRLGVSSDIFTAYSNSTKRRENQQKEVDRLIEESKSLLSEVREGTAKPSVVNESQVVTFIESELSEASKQALKVIPSKMQLQNTQIAILGATNSELNKTSTLFIKVIKSELMRLGVEETKIINPTSEDALYKSEDVQLKISTLSKNQFLLVLLR